MKRSVIFILFIVVGVTVALFVSSRYTGHSKGSANVAAQNEAFGPEAGTMAPDFTLNVLGGPNKTLQLSSLRGKAVLVNFWATYCEPCKVEMPWLVELQNKYGPQGFQILGVAQDEASEKTIMAFARKMGLNYPILQGTDKMNDLYPSTGLPLSVYVDRSGKVVYRAMGLVSESVMEDAIKKALGQGTPTTASK
ncbi:MAG TPA: TlpA disulfide reductase family protein [Candidatus Angelobacter sp.]